MLVAQLCPTLCNSSVQITGVASHSLLQGTFLTQGSNPGLLHCRPIYQGSPVIIGVPGNPDCSWQLWPRDGGLHTRLPALLGFSAVSRHQREEALLCGWERLCGFRELRSHLHSTYDAGKRMLLGEFRAGTRGRHVRRVGYKF